MTPVPGYTTPMSLASSEYSSAVAGSANALRHRVTPLMTPRRLNLAALDDNSRADFSCFGNDGGSGDRGLSCNFLGSSNRASGYEDEDEDDGGEGKWTKLPSVNLASHESKDTVT